MNKREKGTEAERIAEQYLQMQGYTIMERNWRCRSGEIDLIARDGDQIVIVEVRSRSTTSRYGTAVESVTMHKQRKVRSTAEVYLYRTRQTGAKVRFDVMTILFGKEAGQHELQHWQQAF